MYNKILVPLDGSELAEQVLPHVSAVAGCTGAQVLLLRVPAEPVYDYLVPDPGLSAEMRHDIETGAQVYLEEIAAELRSMGIAVSTAVVWGGPIQETLLDVAREQKADLIAMSTHGRSGIARMVIGSVADQIVRHSPVPVLLVRPEPPRVARYPSEQERRALLAHSNQ